MGLFQSYLPPQGVFILLISAIIVHAFLRSKSSRLRSLPLPPGPPITNWLSGHSSIVPITQPWKVYAKWAEKYGPVIHLRVYGQHTIILSSIDDCIEVFEKRANLYTDRPVLTMLTLMGWDFVAAFMPYGPQWRAQRRLFQQSFKRVASLSYRPEQTRKVNDMLYGLLTSPDDFRAHARTVTAAIVMSATYGYDIKPKNDYFVDLAEDAVSRLSLAYLPGAALVNALPILRFLPPWFPGAGFHKVASETKEMTTKMQEVPVKWVQKNMEAGTQPVCIVSEKIGSCKTEEDMLALQRFAGLIYAGKQPAGVIKPCHTDAPWPPAGADTTTTAIETFFFAMTIFPDVQEKAQQELDTVVGSDRLPNYGDWDSLPYTEALLRELLRWRPVVPLGVAHAMTDDDIFKGYLIPKGSVVMPNVWAISRDESRYTDPEAFDPDRFFDKSGNLIDDDVEYVFGFGRRLCPGRHMARATLWLSVVTTLWAFKITKAKDATGKEIPVNVEYTDGFISHPLPHACSITPRSPHTGKIIEEAVAQTRARTS